MSTIAHTAEVKPGDPPHIHHMDTPTAYGAAKLGMWLFLGTEILLFSVMFCSFAIMRYFHLQEFHAGSHHLNKWLGAANTAVLLFSSWTAALAVGAAQTNNNKNVVKYFGISIFCGGIFLVIKTYEYYHKYTDGMFLWGPNFHEFKNFLGLYFCMSGLHALHVIIGMCLMGWVVWHAKRNRYSSRYFTPVELGALYWHLVDLIWIYLFPLLYLVG